MEVSVHGDTLAAVWEEATADGDVVVQLFSWAARAPRTGPMRVHDDVEGRQARPTVDVAEASDGLSVGVTWESGPADGDGAVHFRRFRVE